MIRPRALLGLLLFTCSLAALADVPTAGANRAPTAVRTKLPEPLLSESITDLDGAEAGEIELDATGVSSFRRSTSGAWQSSVEIEWRALERLGLALELGLGGTIGSASSTVFAVRPAASFVIGHWPPLDFHLMAEVSANPLRDDAAENDPGEAAMPVSGGLRAGLRVERFTLRGFVGAGVGAASVHLVPLHLQGAVLYEFGAGSGLGFAGIEADSDWARRTQVTLAPNLVIRGGRLHLPIDVGLAMPWTIAARSSERSLGVLLRLMLEFDTD